MNAYDPTMEETTFLLDLNTRECAELDEWLAKGWQVKTTVAQPVAAASASPTYTEKVEMRGKVLVILHRPKNHPETT